MSESQPPKVRQHAASASGARAAAFNLSENVTVTISSWNDAENDRVLGHARDLADHVRAFRTRDAIASKLVRRVEELTTENAGLRRQIPPTAPTRLLGPGVVRFDQRGAPWVLNARAGGWASFGFRCDSWDDLFRRFDVRVTCHGVDEHGPWWGIENGAQS